MHKIKVEATKFTLVGAANFVLTFVVFTLLLKAFSLHYLLSLFVAWVVGMIFSLHTEFSMGLQARGKNSVQGAFLKILLG